MQLDSIQNVSTDNLLPMDGIVTYTQHVLSKQEADSYLLKLCDEIDWRNDELTLFGKKITTRRQVGWYGDEQFEYRYSNSSKVALPWTKSLLELKDIVQQTTHETYNTCLLNLYHDGSEGMSWHNDNEKELKPHSAIASISLGAERRFHFRHVITGEKVSIFLEHGSLLLMSGSTQSHWKHSLPTTKKIIGPRINLTFRTIIS